MINFIMQRDETPLAVSGVDTGRLATVCIPGGTGTNCTFDKIYKEEFLEMKNLKKVLALVLAMSTVFGLSVSAGAAANDFNDYNEIENKEAVEVMSALNVIGGNDKGDFNPDGYLTRAEMCKMVSYVVNGGQAPVLSTSATPTYTDIKGHWGEAYVEYATSMGIVGGVGGGKFNPDGTLTGTQAAKMMLTAMGYDATVFGFGGAGWDLNVNRYANEAGLYDGLAGMQPNLPITRDDAAQLMYNAMQATMMERGWTLNPATGEKTETYTPWLYKNPDGTTTPVTLLSQKYNGAIQVGYMTDFAYDSVKSEWSYDFTRSASFGGKEIPAQNGVGGTTGTLNNQKSDVDYTALFGQQVKVIYNTKDEKVTYGIYPNDSSVVVEGATGNTEKFNDNAKTVTVSGKDYKMDKIASAINVYNVNSDTANTTLDTLKSDKSAYTFKLVDNTGDGKIDAAIRTPMTVAKINYVGKDTVQLTNGLGTVKLEDLNTYEGLTANDWVYFIDDSYAATGKDTIVKAELKTGTIDGVRGGGDASTYTEYRIGDAWLTASNNRTYTDIVKADVGDTVEYVTLGSTIFYSKITDLAATSKSIALVVTAGTKSGDAGLTGNDVQAKLLFADGTSKIVSVSKMNKQDADLAGNDTNDLSARIGKLVTYRVDGSDYELMDVSTSNKAGFESWNVISGAGTTAYQNGKVGGFELADDAAVYFIGNGKNADSTDNGQFGADADRKADVYTGKEIKNTWGTETKKIAGTHTDKDTVDYAAVLTQEINGFTYAKVVIIADETALPKITAGSNYGYLSSGTYRSVENGKTYLNFTIHTANGKLEAKAESTDAPELYPLGAVVTYDVVSDGVIKNVNVPAVTTGAVTGWDGDSKTALYGKSFKLDDKDATVLYVNSEDKIGVEGASIQKAYKNNDGSYIPNVRYVVSADNVVLLLVDVNNEMERNPVETTLDNTATLSDLQNALLNYGVVTLTDNLTLTGNLDLNGAKLVVESGKTLTLTGELKLSGGMLSGDGKVVVNGNTVMGSTLNIAHFETTTASIAKGATMVITSNDVVIKGDFTGAGQLIIEGNAKVTVQGNVSVDVEANGNASMTYTGNFTGNKTGDNAGAVGPYTVEKDTKVRAFNVVK